MKKDSLKKKKKNPSFNNGTQKNKQKTPQQNPPAIERLQRGRRQQQAAGFTLWV